MAARQSGPKVRRQPQRTCVACRQVEGKRELRRLVKTPEGAVELDPTGKRSGRGAYLHLSRECIQKGFATGAVARALKTELDPTSTQQLQAQLIEQAPDE